MPRLAIAMTLFLGLYIVLVVPSAAWPTNNLILSLVAGWLYALLALGLAAEVTELILALCWPPPTLQLSKAAPPRQKVAVLITVCDDWTIGNLRGLHPLSRAGYDVFVLDDSSLPAVLPSELLHRAVHVRRGQRSGAKGGNLNHWLWQYGNPYEYSVVLDADSSISTEVIDHLVLAAEHPENARVALFQSKVEPIAQASLFARVLAAGARPRARVLDRVHGPMGLLLSQGHNQLLRLGPVRSLGGFDETSTSEDTVLSLDLVATGWQIALVNVWSHDTEPDTVAAYTRRTVRWARQTVELFNHSWRPVPLRLKLLLCRHLLAYLLPLFSVGLLTMSLWSGPTRLSDSSRFLMAALTLQKGYFLYSVTLWSILSISGLLLILRMVVARQEGVPWRTQLLTAVFGGAPLTRSCLFPLLPPLSYRSWAGACDSCPLTTGTLAEVTDLGEHDLVGLSEVPYCSVHFWSVH
jgi:cellulose synthase/poly-beta-1,6-N-acetylglucosamine synthase-like glycosyltransferase